MLSKKGKRKLEYKGENFYWFVRADCQGSPKIHILSEDKKINLEYPMLDLEVPVTPVYIKHLWEKYHDK